MTEKESICYRIVFAAKFGLPIYLGIFSSLVEAKNLAPDPYFTENHLKEDIAFSCNTFRNNVAESDTGNIREDHLRYIYKRAVYFLRFMLFFKENVYIRDQSRLFCYTENLSPEWACLKQPLETVYNYAYNGGSSIELEPFREGILKAMDESMQDFYNLGLLDENKIMIRSLLYSIMWTLEKTRWDYLELTREPEKIRSLIRPVNSKKIYWGFGFSDISEIVMKFLRMSEDSILASEWFEFIESHGSIIANLPVDGVIKYYEGVYQPSLTYFFDRIIDNLHTFY